MLKSPFFITGLPLITERKLPAIPIKIENKMPAHYVEGVGWQNMQGWQKYAERLPVPDEYEYWAASPGCNVGLCLGELAGIVALDFDDRPDLHEAILKLIPDSPVKKKGHRGFTAFYKYRGEKNKKWIVEGETVLELLSKGRQTVLPPSVHPEGMRYKWTTEQTLLDEIDLPELPADFIEQVDALLQVDKREVSKVGTTYDDDLRTALFTISPEDYHTWIEAGMCLHAGGDQYFQLWEDWSRQSDKFKEGECSKKWETFRGTGRTIKSIFWEAARLGYVAPIKELEVPEFLQKKDVSLILPRELIHSAPGLVGEITDWITTTALYPQPELALAAAITFVGVLKGHRVETETGLRTNMYVMGLAPSGSGKDHAITCIQELCRQTDLHKIYGGKPASDSGVLSMLAENARRLVVWDEVGIALKEISDRHVPQHRKAILGLTMELFSAASRTYHGKQYANRDKKSPRVDLVQPCLGIFGLSTPGHFYDSLSAELIADGFLARWLVFDIQTKFPKYQRQPASRFKVPNSIIEGINAIQNMREGDPFTIQPRTVKFSPEADKYLMGVIASNDEKKALYHAQREGMQAIWARAAEHTQKLALVAQSGAEISLECLQWSNAVVSHCAGALSQGIEQGLCETEFAKKMNLALDLIVSHGAAGLDHSILLRKLYKKIGKRAEVLEVIQALVDCGQLLEEKSTGKGRPKTIYKAYIQ